MAILISIYYRKMLNGIENKTFIWVVWICLIATFMDIFMGWSYRLLPVFKFGVVISYFFGYCYFLSRQFMTLAYTVLIFVQTDSIYKLKRASYKIFIILPITISCLFIMSNLFTHQIFTITVENAYKRGPLMPTLYIYSIIYGIFGFIYLSIMRRYLGNMRWLAMVSTYLLLFGAAIYQFLNTGYLLEMLSTAFTLLMVHLILYRSEETFDVDTGLYNRLAFEKQLTCLMLSKRAASILLINFANVHETRNNFGDEKFFTFIKNTEKKIERIIGILNGYKLYYHSSGNMQIIFNQEGVDIERDFPKLIDMWTNFREDSYISILDPKICIVDFPKDFSDAKKMVKFSLFFQQYLKQGQNLLKASEIINSDAFKIQENISDIIASGLKQNNFEMYYQPIFELKTKKFVSAEALIRLHDPKYGLLSPGTFIPAAERTGLILPIGNFVLESVFSFVTDKELINAGLHYIELNLSMEQLLQKDLLDKINQLQNKYGTPPERINLEITESMAGMHSKTEFNNVETLIKNNFSFSLDDYGTGYSNIKRAIDLPLSLVKIDKSIVDIVETPTGKTIIRNTISMMHDVGFKIVCEGVETESQYRLLEKMDCDYIQGFYFAKPMNKKDFISFLQERNK